MDNFGWKWMKWMEKTIMIEKNSLNRWQMKINAYFCRKINTYWINKLKHTRHERPYAWNRNRSRQWNTLWNGVLLIIDAVFHVKRAGRLHPDVIDYRDEVAKRDKKLLALFNTAYETLHVYMGYDGNQEKNVCGAGFRLANDIIDRCAAMLP